MKMELINSKYAIMGKLNK